MPDAAIPDGSPPDAVVCPAPLPGQPGSACTQDTECESSPGAGDGLCIDATDPGPFRWPVEGYCTTFCTDDAQCGEGSFCAFLVPDPMPTDPKGCMPRCCDGVGVGDACSPGRACSDKLYGYIPLGGNACLPGQPDAADGDPCRGFYECDIYSQCYLDPFEAPGGSCRTIDCTVGDDTTCAPGGDGHCIQPEGEYWPVCVDPCTDDADCRQADGYECVDRTSEGLGKYCAHPYVGEECVQPIDCGNAPPWTCLTETNFPGGYCSIVGCTVGSLSSCSLTSTCHDPDQATQGDEYCVTKCDPAVPDACRPGYACVPAGRTATGDPIDGCVPIP